MSARIADARRLPLADLRAIDRYFPKQRGRGGILPVPWIVGDDWTAFHSDAERAHRERLCQVCRETLGSPIVLMRGHLRRETSGPGCHPRCGALAARFCPHLIDGDGLGADWDADEPYADETRVDASAVELTRAELRELATTDPLGRASGRAAAEALKDAG